MPANERGAEWEKHSAPQKGQPAVTYMPKRVASPRIIADAVSAVCGWIEASDKIDARTRELWYNAIAKAYAQLMNGVRIDRDGADFIFPSRTRTGLAHRVNGRCDCEACAEQHEPCWHRAAKWIVLLIEDCERDELIRPPVLQDHGYHCPRCGQDLFYRNDNDDEATAIYLCSNPRCPFQIGAQRFELYAERPRQVAERRYA